MTAQHTPGPWRFYDPDSERRAWGTPDKRIMVLHPDGERLIAQCNTGITNNTGTIPREEIKANARLIAAAPDLLEALHGLMERAAKDAEQYAPEGYEPIWAFIADAQEAIHKATH